MRRKPYRRVSVKRVEIDEVISGRERAGVDVGIDVSKNWLDVVLRWGEEEFERPWRALSPEEIPVLVSRLVQLGEGRRLVAAMESSGTYGDPLRQALTDAGVSVVRVSGKAVHDYSEVFDGVPSSHDGKSAAIVAELAAYGKSSPWPWQSRTGFDEQLAWHVDELDARQKIGTMWTNRIEAHLARYWPEATGYLAASSMTLLRVLAAFGGPGGVAAAGSGGADQVRQWGGHRLSEAKARGLVASAGRTVGIRQTATGVERMRATAEEALRIRGELGKQTAAVRRLVAGHETIGAQEVVAGVGMASVLWVDLGDPRAYDSAGAYRKAMGLNLKIRGSGKWTGHLKITKRGSSRARRWLYYAALRLTKKRAVQGWYRAKRARDGGKAGRALTGLMRKLAGALYQVGARGERYDVRRLFGGGER